MRLQEYEFLAIIRSLWSAKIVFSIKTWQDVDCFDLVLSKANTQQRAGFEGRKRERLRSARIQNRQRSGFEAEKRERLHSARIPRITGIPRITRGSAQRRPNMADQGATAEQIAAIIAQVTIAVSLARVGAWSTTHYVHNTYEADINTGTPDGLKLYLKAVEAKEKDEDRLNISQSNSKAVVTCMKDRTANFGRSVITRKIDDQT